MSIDYLLKTEPSDYSFADLQRDDMTVWDGVANPVALKHLREMQAGGRLIIYETGARKSAVGTATVVDCECFRSENPAVKIKAGKPLAEPVSLARIKANELFAEFTARAARPAFGGAANQRAIRRNRQSLAESSQIIPRWLAGKRARKPPHSN